MNQPRPDHLLPSGGLHAPCSPDVEGTPCTAGGPAALETNTAELKLPVASGGRAAGNRHERERKQRRRAENHRIIALEKAQGCWLCPRQDLPQAELHFHHLDPKKKRDCVCHLVSRSSDTLIEEIRQCRLICSECHEKHHDLVHSEVWQTGGCYDL